MCQHGAIRILTSTVFSKPLHVESNKAELDDCIWIAPLVLSTADIVSIIILNYSCDHCSESKAMLIY